MYFEQDSPDGYNAVISTAADVDVVKVALGIDIDPAQLPTKLTTEKTQLIACFAFEAARGRHPETMSHETTVSLVEIDAQLDEFFGLID